MLSSVKLNNFKGGLLQSAKVWPIIFSGVSLEMRIVRRTNREQGLLQASAGEHVQSNYSSLPLMSEFKDCFF
jgi:hypothetical protein